MHPVSYPIEASCPPEAFAGQSRTIQRLLEIWSRVLGVSPIFPDSDFFDLGGDSLLAVGMLLEVEQEFCRTIPVTAIYDAPTVASLAAMLDAQDEPQFSPIVCLKNGSGGAPLFIVHGIGGTVIELSRLGRQIRTEGPVYALQAKGIDGRQDPFTTVDEMADYYLHAVCEIQPEGPYFLGGYSFGGLVAVEMARRLKERRQDVGLLLLIDAYAHPKTWPLRARASVFFRRLKDRCIDLRGRPLRATVGYGLQKVRDTIRHRSQRRLGAVAGNTVRRWLRQLTIGLPPELRRVYAASEEALDAYVPLFYPGKITFLRAGTPDTVFPSNPLPIWAPLAREFEVHSVPGDHLRLVTEYADSTAQQVSACLDARQRDFGAPEGLQRRSGYLPEIPVPEANPC